MTRPVGIATHDIHIRAGYIKTKRTKIKKTTSHWTSNTRSTKKDYQPNSIWKDALEKSLHHVTCRTRRKIFWKLHQCLFWIVSLRMSRFARPYISVKLFRYLIARITSSKLVTALYWCVGYVVSRIAAETTKPWNHSVFLSDCKIQICSKQLSHFSRLPPRDIHYYPCHPYLTIQV